MSNEAKQGAPVRILVAEDEALIRMDLVEMLQEAGYTVVAQATNGEEAIALATEHQPDLAILDVKMPVLDGISAAEKIISIAPVLMLTAFSQKELVDRARDAGVMAYVVKPFTIGDLVPAIEIAISRHTQMKSLAEEVADLHERLETRKIIDRAKGILMKALNLSEPEAFSWIQRAAMDRRLTMKEVAHAVISPEAALDK
ncbi:ANTAR domain-containing protein [Actinobacteria bacterium IMCC25003]|nr:ANTAR domain-containing protein [Actinobacteria bacterium IMCC25003]